jgi:hypothetical protein
MFLCLFNFILLVWFLFLSLQRKMKKEMEELRKTQLFLVQVVRI